ncbi:dipeptidase [Elongatibacter sediminis]|uniref:Dipeptidase n=1 Tax=Elongatibacter sediminis TaxID=3119006 RepID=A0AAW9R4N8_9GAMM
MFRKNDFVNSPEIFVPLLASLLMALLPFTSQADLAQGTTEETKPAGLSTLHERLLTIDTHVDIPSDFATGNVDPGVWTDDPVSIPKMKKGALDAAFFTVYVGQSARTPENYAAAKATARNKFAAIHRMAEVLYPEDIEIAYSVDDIHRINQAGRLVALIGIENGYAIGKDLSLLAEYHAQGARYMTLAHSGHNDIADSSYPVAEFNDALVEHNGISEFGGKVIAEMNRLGILVDVSHLSKKASLEAARLSVAPVIASHSSARALFDLPRNMDDEQLAAVADTGGVVNVVAYATYLRKVPAEKKKAIGKIETDMGFTSMAAIGKATGRDLAEYRRRVIELDDTWPRATVSDFVDHIDHVINTVGIDHVGISSDFPSGGVSGWMEENEAMAVTEELQRRGYSEQEIGKIWSGNLLRALRAAEEIAACLQSERPRDPENHSCQGG